MKQGAEPMNNTEVTVDRNASPSAYGWCFQVSAGISLMLDYVRDFTRLKMEGVSDDIELTFNNGKKLYAQAKSVTQIGDQRSASKNLTDALKVLSEDEQRGDALKLVYITNIENPLSSKSSSAFKYDRNYDFSILPLDAKKKIIDKVGVDFPTDKFQLQIIYFFGESDNKFQSIKEKIKEFLNLAIDNSSYSQRLLENWVETFMANAADEPNKEKKMDLSKKQVIFPVIAIIIDPPISEGDFNKVCDYENYTEITQEFRKIINDSTFDYEFIVQVLGDYFDKRITVTNKADYKYEFTKNEWQSYEKEFVHINNVRKRQALIKILLLTIITQNEKINQIKGAANL